MTDSSSPRIRHPIASRNPFVYDSDEVPLATELQVIETHGVGGEQGTSRSRDQKWMKR